ncbi:MAG: ImmA/IrrE family metallo-endopeptidase [Gammaproteobacteria bacterium]|nr:ImmA/IrrE family metallo-endopeptidase [Gammaproteobacteria bacterium]
MRRGMEAAVAVREAENVIAGLGEPTLPIDPLEIATDHGIEVRPMPGRSPGVSGMFLHHAGGFGILYNTHLGNERFERFSVAHELGHYHLPGHPEHILNDQGFHLSDGGFVSDRRYELEADHFAAALLMPRQLFLPAMDRAGVGLDAIESLAEQCQTSMPATAIQYATHTPECMAIVVSRGGAVDYCFMSEGLKELRGLDWLRKGTPLARDTVTSRFNREEQNVLERERDYGTSSLQDWLGGPYQLEVEEEVIGLGRYGRTLTVLRSEEPIDQEDLDDEEELEESWEPRFRR